MNRKINYPEPPLPAGTAPFKTCAFEVAKLPLDVFLRANDGRKFLIKCRHRKALLQILSTYADADGTSCFPSRETLLREAAFSEGTLNRYLEDLESSELRFITRGGYAWEGGNRVRRLVLPLARVQDSSNSVLQDSKAGVQDSRQEFRIGNSGLQDSKAGVQPRLSTTSQYSNQPVEDQKLLNQPEENQKDGKPSLSSRLKSTAAAMNQEHPVEKNQDAEDLLGEIASLTDGIVLFTGKNKAPFVQLVDKCGKADTMAAFKKCWQNVEGDEFEEKHAARKFAEGGEYLVKAVRDEQKERERQAALAKWAEEETERLRVKEHDAFLKKQEAQEAERVSAIQAIADAFEVSFEEAAQMCSQSNAEAPPNDSLDTLQGSSL